MPQLDFMSFFVQVFWITVLVFIMHLIYLYFFLGNTGSVIKFREKIKSKISDVPVSNRPTKLWDTAFKSFIKVIKSKKH